MLALLTTTMLFVVTAGAEMLGCYTVYLLLYLRGPVSGRLVRSDAARAHTTQWLCDDEDGGGAMPLVLIVVSLGLPRFSRHSRRRTSTTWVNTPSNVTRIPLHLVRHPFQQVAIRVTGIEAQ